MESRRRLVSALDSFVRYRQKGVRSKRHVVPLAQFAAAELIGRGVESSSIRKEAPAGHFYIRQVDLVVEQNGRPALLLFVITQSGSVRKNLNNRRREIVGDALNLRLAHPNARVALVYLLCADEEATQPGTAGTSPLEELAAFLRDLQQPFEPFDRPLLDGAALLAADRDRNGRIRVESVPEGVDVLGHFFDRLVQGLVRCNLGSK